MCGRASISLPNVISFAPMKKLRLLAACVALGAATAHADWAPKAVSVEASTAVQGTHSLGVGLVWPWQWQSGPWTAQTELMLAEWSARGPAGRENFTQLSLQPLVRYRFAGTWFAELGIGLSYTDRVYFTADKTFSTRFNFKDTIGAGTSFGARDMHELGVRITHFSNAGIKNPNPGENFLQLRYQLRF